MSFMGNGAITAAKRMTVLLLQEKNILWMPWKLCLMVKIFVLKEPVDVRAYAVSLLTPF